MNEFEYQASDEAGTERFGAALAGALPRQAVIALVGTLGAGKTRLVQALAAACGVPREEVVSPTFVLCQTYEGDRLIHHLDAYRIRDEDDFRELGVEELFASPALVIVEWADRVAGAMPEDVIQVEIEVTGQFSRRFRVQGNGAKASATLANLRRAISA